MSIRTINYTVTANGITPATQQFGGVQGEHNATELVFTLDAALLETIREKVGENEVVYRFDVHDGAGGVTPTDPLPLIDAPPVYLLENKVTRIGGNISVFLIITEIENETTEMELFTFPALIRLKEKEDGAPNDSDNLESVSTLSQVAKKAAKSAEESAESAEVSATNAYHAQLQTEAARLALESGAEVVFLGGNHAANIEILAAVDSELSEASHNPVENKKVFAEFKKVNETIHPVGSLYWSDTNINPADIYGGEWELVDKVFANAYFVDNGSEGAFAMSENVSSYAFRVTYDGHTMHIRLDFIPTIAITDNNIIQIGKFNLEKIGVNSFHHSIISIPTMSNSSNGLVMATIDYTGSVVINDVIQSTNANERMHINETVIIRNEDMLDSACDKFCWKRVA